MKRHFATIVVAIPLLSGGFVLAEDTMKPADSKMQQLDNQQVVTRRLSKCIGKDVYNHDGKKIGDVKDVVLDGGTNRVSYVVVSYGGIAGIGDKLFAVPWRALESRSIEPDKTFLNVSEDTMKNAPGFDDKHWPDMASKTFRAEIDRYYGDTNHTGDMKSDMKHDMNNMKHDMNDSKHDVDHNANRDLNTTAVNPNDRNVEAKDGLLWTRRASLVIGADVRNPANQNLGSIEDLVVNARTGQVQYAVLSFGGVLGIGDKLFAIPVNSLQARTDDDKYILDVSKDRLKNAPGFNKKNWPDFADASFRGSVDDYYNNGNTVKKDTSAKTE